MKDKFIYETILELIQSDDVVISYKRIKAIINIYDITSILEVNIDVVDNEADFVKETLRCVIIMLKSGLSLTVPMSLDEFLNKYKDVIDVMNYSNPENNSESFNFM